jgi:hypothetical protein
MYVRTCKNVYVCTSSVCIYLCMYVCMYVCMDIAKWEGRAYGDENRYCTEVRAMYVCTYMYVCMYTYVCTSSVCMYVCMYGYCKRRGTRLRRRKQILYRGKSYVCMYVHVCMYMYVRALYVFIYVCMYVCMDIAKGEGRAYGDENRYCTEVTALYVCIYVHVCMDITYTHTCIHTYIHIGGWGKRCNWSS